jgi:hypothetical protein
MSTPGDVHKHYCNWCWNLYECECTATLFAPGSYRCPECLKLQTDAEFLRAIGVDWDGRLPTINVSED